MRLAALQSVVNASSAGSSGYPRPPSRPGFPSGEWHHFLRRPPISCESGSSSRELRLLFRVRPSRTCPVHGCTERLPWSSRSPSRHQSWRSTCDRGSTPDLRSALGVSHAPDGFRPPRPRGLVSSHNHVRDSPFRGFPRHPAEASFDVPCPPVVGHRLLPRVAPRLRHRCPRLQGLAPGCDPLSSTRRFRPRRDPIPS
jgi:hypothetical protein